MKVLLRAILIMASFFIFILLVVKLAGQFGLDSIKELLLVMKETSPYMLGPLISLLLITDLFITVPTLSLCMLAGYFLGFELGAFYSLVGLYISGILGYTLSQKYGERIISFVTKSASEKAELESIFSLYGTKIIMLSRIAPMLPEISACLSGSTKLSFKKFILAWSVNSIPYALLATYSGSISSFDEPKPAIYTAIALYLIFALLWSRLKKSST